MHSLTYLCAIHKACFRAYERRILLPSFRWNKKRPSSLVPYRYDFRSIGSWELGVLVAEVGLWWRFCFIWNSLSYPGSSIEWFFWTWPPVWMIYRNQFTSSNWLACYSKGNCSNYGTWGTIPLIKTEARLAASPIHTADCLNSLAFQASQLMMNLLLQHQSRPFQPSKRTVPAHKTTCSLESSLLQWLTSPTQRREVVYLLA